METDNATPTNSTTPAPSNWEHTRILLARNLRNDRKKPWLWFARVFGVALMFMLYTIGFFLGYDDQAEGEKIVRDGQGNQVRLYGGTSWVFPAKVRLAGQDAAFARQVGQELNATIPTHVVEEEELFNPDTPVRITKLEAFSLGCEQDEIPSAYDEICIFLQSNSQSRLLYPGKEDATPFQEPLAGAQYAINEAIWKTFRDRSATNYTSEEDVFVPVVEQIQRTPELIRASESASKANIALILVPGLLHCLATAIMAMFIMGPPNTEQINEVVRSFVLVGVKLRTYVLTWWIYQALNGLVTAAVLTLVSIFWNITPQSNWLLIFFSHYLAILGIAAVFVFLSQIIKQEELAQGLPWLGAFASMAIVAPCLILVDVHFVVLYLATAISPFAGIMHYNAVYATYDFTGVDTGIHIGDGTVQESGLLGVYTAQVICILLYVGCMILYASPHFRSFVHHKLNRHHHEPKSNRDDEEETIRNENFEPLAPGSDVLVQVRGVYHTYTPDCCTSMCSKTARPTEVLKGLDMDICRGEVFGFLGHNGAGKSTSVQLLSAEHPLQDGNVTYHLSDGQAELDNPDHADRIRGKIGVCPQHNDPLQEDLTCREILRLFAQLKGRVPKRSPDQPTSEAIEEEIENRLKDIAFTSAGDADKEIGTYSGGMKRKVSIALALLGSPEVVYLDEPTAGMDPYNRRQIWDMIIAAKKNRSIILCSHFLDEVDLLSDRIGILKDGVLITCGTSLFLKHSFGVGYTLRFQATEPVDISSMVADAKPLLLDMPGRYEWRLQHGSEPNFPSLLDLLEQADATQVSLDLTTLEEVFLQTGKEEDNNEEAEDTAIEEEPDTNAQDAEDLEAGASSTADKLRQIWKQKGTIRPLGFWRKFFLVQNFMMMNAWKIKGTIFLNVAQPLGYLIAGIAVSGLVKVQDKGERVVVDPVPISTYMAGTDPVQFFGVLDRNASISPLVPTEEPETLGDYFADASFPVLGGYYSRNATLQYNPDLSEFSLQIAILALSNVLAAVGGQMQEVATIVQQLPYISDAPYRIDLLVLPMCMGFGFVGMAFSVLDVLLLKGDGIISLFRVAGITEWTTYLGVMFYKCTSSFAPFFVLVIVLGYALKSVIMGNAGRWLATIITMLCYAYSTTPIGLILAKRFIHSNFKSVANWFPGVYMTFISLPYVAWVSALQALPESRDLILVIGDVLCVVPQFAFQRALGAVIEVSTKFDDPDLTWNEVWSWESRVWFANVMMFAMGSLEWGYLFKLTTSRPATTKKRKEDPDDAFEPINIESNAELEEQHNKSLQDDGINARELVKVFRVPLPDKESKKAKKDATILKRVVKGVSLHVGKNEVFTLLGPNGAGKSVTMGMLVSEHTPEHGSVVLEGRVASSDTKDTGHLYQQCEVSYCPQFDALFPKMTVQQHLKFYAQIRGLDWDEECTQEHIHAIVQLLGLSKHKDKESTELSGGYKRRLSLAVAMIGYPKVMMADEPTTGVDPGARHLVWDVLKPSHTHEDYDIPGILLSTHYMDEAGIGDQIAIMIDGEIVTVGSLPSLQSKYCTSYFAEISLDPFFASTSEDAVVEAFVKGGMEAKVYESLPYRFKLQLPFQEGNRQKQLADIFGLLEREKNALGIKFYSVEQMNLEKIFIDLSRKQFEAEERLLSERSGVGRSSTRVVEVENF